MASNSLEVDILTADLRHKYIPVFVEEEKIVPDTTDGRVWLNLMREEFAGLKAVLFGQDGQGGFLPDLKAAVEKVSRGLDQLEDQLSGMATTQIRDRAEVEAKIQAVKADVDSIGTMARGNRDALSHHCDDDENAKKFAWEKVFGIGGLVVAIGGLLFGFLK